jgi:hypothetical protein
VNTVILKVSPVHPGDPQHQMKRKIMIPKCRYCQHKFYNPLCPTERDTLQDHFCSKECLIKEWEKQEAWSKAVLKGSENETLKYRVVFNEDNKSGYWCAGEVVKGDFNTKDEAYDWMIDSLQNGELEGCFIGEVSIEPYGE